MFRRSLLGHGWPYAIDGIVVAIRRTFDESIAELHLMRRLNLNLLVAFYLAILMFGQSMRL